MATASTQEPERVFHLETLGSGLEADLEGTAAPLSPFSLPPLLVVQSCTRQSQTPTSAPGGPLLGRFALHCCD